MLLIPSDLRCEVCGIVILNPKNKHTKYCLNCRIPMQKHREIINRLKFIDYLPWEQKRKILYRIFHPPKIH